MSRSLLPLLFFIATFSQLNAQTLASEPASSNPQAEWEFQRFVRSQQNLLRSQFGLQPPQTTGGLRTGQCEPEFLGNLVVAGSKLFVVVDTFGLGRDTTPATLTLLNGNSLKWGTATLQADTLFYTANPGLVDMGIDTALVEFAQSGFNDTIHVVIHVVRPGKRVVAPTLVLAPEGIQPYCLENVVALPAPLFCSEFLPSAPSYDGLGRQNFHFTTYLRPDTCLVYYASRFPGMDTVTVRICDQLTVCDTFLIPVRITGDTIKSLPFFDDFSQNGGAWPSPDRWLDNDVFINNTLAPNPPSVGMATFDGLDRRGRSYEVFEGKGDQLTSKAIDLSGLASSSGVYLKFFLAPKGYGLQPEKVDSFIVEFRNKDRQWVQVATILNETQFASDSFPPFTFYSLPVDQPQFFHKAFQFRFTNFVSPGGFIDLWHLDYVRLSAGEGGDANFEDIALTQLPTGILKSFTAMPLWHLQGFEDKELTDTLYSHLYNHSNATRSLANSSIVLEETTAMVPLASSFTLTQAGEDNNLEPKIHLQRKRIIPPANFSQLKQSIAAIQPAESRSLRTTYAIVPQTAQPTELRSNDTVTLHIPLADFMAHDDGTAERQVFVKFAAGGEQIATRYHANVGDTLRGVQFMFPHVNGDIESQVFNLRVWVGSLDSEPVFERQLLKPFFPDNVFDTLQGFTTYRLEDFLGNETPVYIPPGDFYIGWQQVTPAAFGIPVGLDYQHPCECNFANLGGSWQPFPQSIRGALMIRPVFGDEAPRNTTAGTADLRQASEVARIFPVPASDAVYIQLLTGLDPSAFRMQVADALGRNLYHGPLTDVLPLDPMPQGVLIVVLEHVPTGTRYFQRIIHAE